MLKSKQLVLKLKLLQARRTWKNLRAHQLFVIDDEVREYWHDLGVRFGYPTCCITHFCNQEDRIPQQLEAAGNTGFVPCPSHALKVVSGEIKLEDLIVDRDTSFNPFPNLED